jgi:hypothetical protein
LNYLSIAGAPSAAIFFFGQRQITHCSRIGFPKGLMNEVHGELTASPYTNRNPF